MAHGHKGTKDEGRRMKENETTMMNNERGPWFRYVITGLVFAAAAYGVMALYQNIMLRKREAQQTAFELANLTEDTVDPKEWGKTFPRQYDGYLRTVDTQRTRYGGSENFQRLDDDPR